MLQVNLLAIKDMLLEEHGLDCVHDGDSLHTEFQVAESVLCLDVRLFGNWVSFELTSQGVEIAALASRISRQLLAVNSHMRLAKFGKNAEGSLILSIDLPIHNFTKRHLAEITNLLTGYAEVYFSQLGSIGQQVEDAEQGAKDRWLQKGIERLTWHIRESPSRLNYNHATGGKLPRNHIWRPYRFCVQDVLFGAIVVRHAREHNCLEVDVFLTTEIPQYEPDSGARWLALFLLSEAYKCGGSMEIRFTEFVEGKRIPFALCQLADSVDASFQTESIKQGRITPQEARDLFAKITGFSSELRERINELNAQRRLSVERVCYSIHHGVWALNEIESIVLSSPYPDMVLSGEIQPEQRHLYSYVLFQARSSLLGGFLDRKMALREHTDESGAAFDLEDDERNIIVEFEASIYGKRYSCPDESIPVPWLLDGQEYLVEPSDSIVVLVRARDAIGIKQHLAKDIDLIGERALQSTGARYFVLVPFDFNDPYISDDDRQALVNRARSKQVGIMVCPESVSTLDVDVRKRLMSSRIMRE